MLPTISATAPKRPSLAHEATEELRRLQGCASAGARSGSGEGEQLLSERHRQSSRDIPRSLRLRVPQAAPHSARSTIPARSRSICRAARAIWRDKRGSSSARTALMRSIAGLDPCSKRRSSCRSSSAGNHDEHGALSVRARARIPRALWRVIDRQHQTEHAVANAVATKRC